MRSFSQLPPAHASAFLRQEAQAQRHHHQQMQDWMQANRDRSVARWLLHLMGERDARSGTIMLRPRLRVTLQLGLLALATIWSAFFW